LYAQRRNIDLRRGFGDDAGMFDIAGNADDFAPADAVFRQRERFA
jgi:hypothetical protein